MLSGKTDALLTLSAQDKDLALQPAGAMERATVQSLLWTKST